MKESLSSSIDASQDCLFGSVDRELKCQVVAESRVPFNCWKENGDVSLRQWLDNPARIVDAVECVHIFRQIVEIVSAAHSHGIVVNNVRPSCFVMSSINRVSFIESASCSDSGSDSPEEEPNNQSSREIKQEWPEWRARLNCNDDIFAEKGSQMISASSSCLRSRAKVGNVPFIEEKEENSKEVGFSKEAEEGNQAFPMKTLLLMEINWYTSPEEIAGGPSSCASDIYRLGVLLFELFCIFSSTEGRNSTMSSLRHRVLPPNILLNWPKVASFCLWLLHPNPSTRPNIGDLLQSDFLSQARDDIKEREAAIELREKIEEEDALLEFLRLIRQSKQEACNKLQDMVSLLSCDIEQVLNKQRAFRRKKGSSSAHHSYSHLPLLFHMVEPEKATSIRKRGRLGEVDIYENQEETLLLSNHDSRLVKNLKELESAYLLTRQRPTISNKSNSRGGGGSVVLTEPSVMSSNSFIKEEDERSGWVSPFLDSLCKYLSFTKLRVKADLKQGDLLITSSNLVCSLSFDRDAEFFASAGVNKKIKVFECDSILNQDRDIHYPVVEMASRSKFSSICWNSYIKTHIASSNFEGVVQVWDVSRGQVFVQFKEHEKRVWSVDFSLADPTILASGSDDGSVKLWSINQGASIGTIRTKANVCSVKFPLDCGRYFAFGSADHKVYYYDLRNPRVPLYTLVGHNKTVSYVKFIDSTNLVSASTDNTVKLWDLSTNTSRILDNPLQCYTGHVNVKNFVGLSVSEDGYIATGSETNEVFVYHKAFPMPALSYNSSSSSNGHESNEASQFISSVCWRGNSSTLVAANSTGDIKILEMV